MPYPWSVNDILTAADLNAAIATGVVSTGLAAGAAYTPVWGSTGTAPALGNGTIVGAYYKVGRWIVGRAVLTIGSTSTFGTGSYTLSLPAVAATGEVGTAALGPVGCYDTSAATRFFRQASLFTNSTALIASEAGALIGPAAPFAWAVGDIMFMKFSYEALT